MIIKVLPYNAVWAEEYKRESALVKKILGDLLIDVYHIGGTAVKGLCSRPVIDIMPLVKDINIVDDFDETFEDSGYECLGEFGIGGRRFYRKVSGEQSFHIEIFDIYSERNIINRLAFRDYLREHPQEASFYGELKQALAAQFPEDIEGYSIGKSVFMDKLEAAAAEWYINKFSVC